METILKNTDKNIILKAQDILCENALSSDDMLKREKYTCYTIQKKAFNGKYFNQSEKAFLDLGYKPEIESEDEDFITYKLPYC
jgi:hypothetical protein